MNRIGTWLFLMMLSGAMIGQQLDPSQQVRIYENNFQDDFEEEEEETRRGVIFGLNFGAYFANKASANFYNGNCLYTLGDNVAVCNDIETRLNLGITAQQVQNDLGIQSFTIPADASPEAMRYNPGLLIGFRFGYRLNNENAFICDVNYVNLKAADKFSLTTNLTPDNGQGTADIRLFNIIGEEDRLNLSLGYRTGLMINDNSNWFFGAGGSMVSTRLNTNYLEIEGRTYDLWVNFIGPNNFNGPNGNLTATGFGWYGETGVEAFFDERFEANVGIRFSKDKIVMGSYEEKLMNWHIFFTVSI